MQFIPKDLFSKLEFDKVLRLIEQNCLGPIGIEHVKKIQIHTNKPIIERLLMEVDEFKVSMEQRHNFPIGNYEVLDQELKMLAIEGYVLPVEGLQRINIVLLQIGRMFDFFNKSAHREQYPTLHDIIKSTTLDEELRREIERIIDENGDIRPDASPELMRIRKLMISKRKELDKKFRDVINLYQSKGWLAENVESFRNGRRVLSVPSEHKRKVRGIIHDESATGKTAFIEPEPIIEVNNDIFDLDNEERREIHRILRDLSNKIRPYLGTLHQYQKIVGRYDLIQAKAKLARQMKANLPQLKEFPTMNWHNACHPLLFLKNQKEGKKTVPFDLTFHQNNRILVLSGPNAGGKSIAMKSVGLLQLMVQAGLLVPANPASEVGIFEQFFADIGDQQSLEDDLSTYSSRLKNAKLFVENANDKTLVLIDEFGSGTDPKIGGAIAEAILKFIHQKKVFGVITTHYSILKVFAFKTKGIINGSMNFDKDSLSPTYELKVGRPGSSYAYEIAQKSGLQQEVIDYAKHKTGANEKAVDELLVDLQREKQEVEEELKSMKERQKQLDKLISSYEQMHRDMDYKRKKMRLEAKEKALQEVTSRNKEYENLVREIRENQNVEKAKKLAIEAKREREQIASEMTELVETIYHEPAKKVATKANKGPIKEGDFVKLKTGGATGQVESIDRNVATVVMGLMRITAKIRDLQHASEPLEVKKERSVNADILQNTSAFNSKLDIRGMRREEAIEMVERFVDEAIISNVPSVRVIHGKGNGVLRNAVRDKLRTYKQIETMRYEADERGGNGVTIVEF